MSERKAIVYITAYCIDDKGKIRKVNAEIRDRGNGEEYARFGRWGATVQKPFWHETEAEAITQAETMRAERIASLEKSIAKAKSIKFRIVEVIE